MPRHGAWVVGLSVVAAAVSAVLAVRARASDVRSYHAWILDGLPGWTVPGPYPLGADLVWLPLRAFSGPNNNLWWLLGWTGPATVIACVILWRTASRPATAVTCWLLGAALLERTYWMRLEPLAAVLALVMVVQLRRGKVATSALALSAGALVKVWPAFFLPSALLGLAAARSRRWVFWFAIPWVAYAVAIVALRPPAAMSWLTFAVGRRIQVESLTALPALWAMALGSHSWTIRYFGGLDSADLVLGPHLREIHLGLDLLALAGFAVLALRLRGWLHRTRELRADAGGVLDAVLPVVFCAQIVALLLLIFSAPVFSPQYLAWFAPVFAIAAGEGLLKGQVRVWLVACALTTAEFPYLWGKIRNPHVFAISVLTLRDVVLFVLLAMALRQLWRLTARAPQNPQPTETGAPRPLGTDPATAAGPSTAAGPAPEPSLFEPAHRDAHQRVPDQL